MAFLIGRADAQPLVYFLARQAIEDDALHRAELDIRPPSSADGPLSPELAALVKRSPNLDWVNMVVEPDPEADDIPLSTPSKNKDIHQIKWLSSVVHDEVDPASELERVLARQEEIINLFAIAPKIIWTDVLANDGNGRQHPKKRRTLEQAADSLDWLLDRLSTRQRRGFRHLLVLLAEQQCLDSFLENMITATQLEPEDELVLWLAQQADEIKTRLDLCDASLSDLALSIATQLRQRVQPRE